MPLIFHWGGLRHGDVDDLPPELLASPVLVYDGPRWFGVYERLERVQMRSMPDGPAEVWVVREQPVSGGAGTPPGRGGRFVGSRGDVRMPTATVVHERGLASARMVARQTRPAQ
jgi:hypothetical protein